ncbi:MAG: F0F1 ATP synthase subunit epsilon [Geminicoccales bacterium]
MNLKVALPAAVLVDEPIRKIVVDAENGSFAILPRHVDFLAALVPGVLTYLDAEGHERFLGIDEATLVKCGDDVLISTRNAVEGDNLSKLRRQVEVAFILLDERERSARSALARLEAGIARRFVELKD